MNENFNESVVRRSSEAIAIDAGLRAYMLRVYNYMAMALGLTGLVAYFVANTPALAAAIWGGPQAYIVIFAPLAFSLFFYSRLQSFSFATMQMMFWAFAALMGLSLSSIFLSANIGDVSRAFFITAATFGALSLYGYTTKRDLTGWGSFLFMGAIGLMIAMVVNIFLAGTMLQFIISVVGVLVFSGLIAYDTQKIKEMYWESDASDVMGKKAIMGALALYMDFINLFIMILNLLRGARQ